MKKALIFLLTVLLFSTFLPSGFTEEAILAFGEGEPDIVGKPFPDFYAKDTKRNVFTLSETLKEYDAVLINVFASWCGPCMREFPLLNEAYEQYKDRVAFIGLDFEPEDTILDVAEIHIGHKVLFPMARTAGTGLNEYLGSLNVPCTLVVDRFGTLCFKHSNLFEDVSEINRVLETFVGENYTESRVLSTVPMETATRAFPVSGARAVHVDNENARKIVIRYGEDDYSQYGFIVDDDIARLRFELAPDDQPGEMVYDIQAAVEQPRHALPSMLDPERNAFVYDQPMELTENGGRVIVGELTARSYDDYENICFFLFPDEESVEKELDAIRADYPGISWEYVEEETPEAAQRAAGSLHCIDQYGAPVPGVTVSFCTDRSCTALSSDENGLITFTAPAEEGHVQVLRAPAGYSFDPDFEFSTGYGSGEWKLLIRKD